MLSQRTLAVLTVLCLAISLVARMLDQRARDAHSVALTTASSLQDPSAPFVKLALSDRTPTVCAKVCTLSHNIALLDGINMVSLILGLGFAVTALWKHLK